MNVDAVRLKKMAEKKVGSRTIAIVLGVACIILAVGLVVALVAYLPSSSQIDSLNTQIAQKDQAIAGLNLQITSLQAQINSLNSSSNNVAGLQDEITSLQGQIQSLYNVLYLNASAILVSNQAFSQEPNTNVTVWDQPDQPLVYAGYVTVQVQSSSNLTYVQVLYYTYGVSYNNVVTLGSGTASFPVLPGAITIVLGNTEPNDSVTGTVNVVYYY
jgi:cell division protein FtsL